MKIDIEAAPRRDGTRYPPPHDAPCRLRQRRQLGDAAGLTQFGVNLLRLAPGVWSSQRHYHSAEDEFVMVMHGEVVLVTDAGEQVLRTGECAGFKAGVLNGHCLQNRSENDVVLLEVGGRSTDDTCQYPDIDLHAPAETDGFTRKDGTPF